MPTKLYLRDTTANTAGYARTEKSTTWPRAGNTSVDGGHAARDLSTTKGTSQTSLVTNTANSATTQDLYFTKWISAPLSVSQIDDQQWNIRLAFSESSGNANMSWGQASLYVLKSDDTVRGFVFDVNGKDVTEFATSEDGISTQIAVSGASAVASVISTDRLAFEIWTSGVITMAGTYGITIYYDGTTDVVDATTTDAASYIEAASQDITFAGGAAATSLAYRPLLPMVHHL